MRCLLLSLLTLLSFSGCSQSKVSPAQSVSLPHYNPQKANLYFVNTDTDSLGEYKVAYECAKQKESMVVLSRQYSYHEFDADSCSVSVTPYSTNPLFGEREDHAPLAIDVKAGESYVFKIDKTTDAKTILKAAFAYLPTTTTFDYQLTVKLEDKAIAAKEIQEIIEWKPFLLERLYPPRATGKTMRDYL